MSTERDVIKKISVYLNTETAVQLLRDVIKLSAFNAPSLLAEIDQYQELQYEPKDNKFIKAVFNSVSDTCNISINTLLKPSRKRDIVDARKMAFYFMHKGTRLSLSKIAAIFNKDHATVIHNCRGFESLYATDKGFKAKADVIHSMLVIYGYGEHIASALTNKSFIEKSQQTNGQVHSNNDYTGQSDQAGQRNDCETGYTGGPVIQDSQQDIHTANA